MIAILWAPIEKFWSREAGTVRVDLTVLRKLGITAKEELRLEDWFPPLGPYPLKDEVGMGVACVT